jgi:hypothetical protein
MRFRLLDDERDGSELNDAVIRQVPCHPQSRLPGRLAEQVGDVAGPLIRRPERDYDLPRAAALTSQSVFHLG